MTIKQIFDEIAAESSTNQKQVILTKYKDNDVLKRVLYLANSKRIKFYMKQVLPYVSNGEDMPLEWALESIMDIANREVSGDAARDYLASIQASLSADDAYIIERIIDKDCKIGLGTTYMNKVFKDLIEDTKYMGAKPYDSKLVSRILAQGKAVSQLKADGRYCAAILRNGEVELESRSGEPTIITGANLLTELSGFGQDLVLTGELTVKGISSKYTSSAIRTVSNGIIASLIDICSKRQERGEEETFKKIAKFEEKHSSDYESSSTSFQEALDSVIYVVWDTVSVDEYYEGKSDTPYLERLKTITDLIDNKHLESIDLIESVYVNDSGEAFDHFKQIMDRGLEGTILKTLTDGWRDGKPWYCVKLKLEMEVDLVITGFNYGTKGTKNEFVISSLNAESSCGRLKTRPQGLDEPTMVYITEYQEKLLGTVISVKCNGVSKPKNSDIYALMYPAFMDFRQNEKVFGDSLEEILEIETSAISLASK
jgi:hypothetical protein